ncbi:MAG TPA: oligosaccharide flippase family protein, partial [Patescibacteria group bacterium]
TAYIFWLAFAEMLFYISGFIVQAAAGHILGPAQYGIFGLIVTLTILIASLIGNGIPIAMSKFLSSEFKRKPELVSVIKRKGAIAQFILMAIVTAVFFFASPLIAQLLHDPSLTGLLRISTFIIPCFAADAFYFYYYTGIHQFNMQSLLKSIRSVLRVLLIVGLGYFMSLEGFITGYIYVPLAVFIVALLVDQFVYTKRFPKESTLDFPIKKLIFYALPITGFLLLYQAMISLDLFAVKSILQDDYQTGLFNGAFTVAQIPNYLFYALTIVLLPVVSHSTANEEKQKTTAAITKALRTMYILLVAVVALIIGYAKPLMIFFFGSQYAAGSNALELMAFGVGLLTLFYVMSFAFQGAGLVKLPLRIAFFGMLANATLNVVLIRSMGILGAGLATSITAIFVTIALFYFLKKEFDSYLKFATIAKTLFAGLIILFLSLFLPGSHLLFIISGAILFALYLAILYLLKELNKEDLLFFLSMLPGRRKKHST